MNHEEITKNVTPPGGVYGQGVTPNPYESQQAEWQRRHVTAATRKLLTDKITSLFEPRFVTPPETSECIESIITMTDSRKILEVGQHTGFGSLHMLRAIVGKENAKLTSIDCRPALDREFFSRPEIAPWFRFVEGWTPQIFEHLYGEVFDLVFIDSDHSVEHCEKERASLIPITRRGTIFIFHDVPEWTDPVSKQSPPVVGWLNQLVHTGFFRGLRFPSCQQLDALDLWGVNYPRECNPGLGVYIRN